MCYRAPKWISTNPDTWSDYVMTTFILDQNNYSYDDKPPIKHASEYLISFCGMDDDPTWSSRFNRAYSKIYS